MTAYASVGPTLPPGFSGRGVAVASVNMDSRRLAPQDVAERANVALAGLIEEGYRPAFNKVDSTLRGHTGLEALTAVRSCAARGFVLAPAFPANGRTVTGGLVRLHGIPVDRSEVGRDPLTPLASSDLSEVLARNCGLEPARLELETVRRGQEAVARYLDRTAAVPGAQPGPIAIAADAETDEDLDVLAAAGLTESPRWLLSGSAGLAAAIARRLTSRTGGRHAAMSRRLLPASPVQGPRLVVVGSQRKLAAEAAHALARSTGTRLVGVAGSRLLGSGGSRAEHDVAVRSVVGHLTAGKSAVLVLDAADVLGAPGSRPHPGAVRDSLVASIGEIVSAALGQVRPGALVIVGGDTAAGVLTALGAAGIVLHDEPLPGAAAGTLDGGSHPGMPVVTKAGAFGDRGTLSAIFDYLAEGDTE